MRILYIPYQPHCFAYGGFDIQMLSAGKHIQSKSSCNIIFLDPWDRNVQYDIVHLWGYSTYNYHIAIWAKKQGKKLIATLLLPYAEGVLDLVKHYSGFIRTHNRVFKNNLGLLDQIVVLNEEQKFYLTKYWGVSKEKISIVPNIVEDVFFDKSFFNENQTLGVKDYILCTGNVCPRKNQLNLALSCEKLNKALVIVGKTLDGESEYANELARVINRNDNMLWIHELPYGSKEIRDLYYGSSLVALPSFHETQPISLLEAIAMERPILTLNRPYAKQKFFNHATLSKNGSIEEICNAIVSSASARNKNNLIYECSGDNVADEYIKLYEYLIGNKLT